ncbi:hypothetical protein EI94DRAFT_1736549 [Lactarius quietus]|nr:hypothetical protein EI94DRAFT_1736549 [Lactarius quietus]
MRYELVDCIIIFVVILTLPLSFALGRDRVNSSQRRHKLSESNSGSSTVSQPPLFPILHFLESRTGLPLSTSHRLSCLVKNACS